MIKIGVIGCGYWGPNLIRNFMETKGAWISAICDIDKTLLRKLKRRYPSLHTETNYRSLLRSSDLDAIAIATPVGTHFSIAKEALEQGKHVLVEKPLATSVKEAKHLIKISEKKKLCLMVDHTFVYSNPVKILKKNLSSIGKLRYFDSTRVNLGLFQKDINVLWDLAPHDLSILLYLVNQEPKEVAAFGIAHVNKNVENTVYLIAKYEDNFIAHFHFNWLSPVKIRMSLISGTKKMIVYNDLDPKEQIKIYDYSVTHKKISRDSILVDYRMGDIFSPHIGQREALMNVCDDFVQCIREKKKPISDGHFGMRVVRVLEAADRSLKKKGVFVKV